MIILVLLILALICFLLATFGATVPHVNLTALGLAFVTLTLIIPLV